MSLYRRLLTRFAHVGHGSGWHRGRDENGVMSKVCDHCLQPIEPLIVGKMLTTGPAQLPPVVAGEPTGKARRVTRANVAPWKVSSR